MFDLHFVRNMMTVFGTEFFCNVNEKKTIELNIHWKMFGKYARHQNQKTRKHNIQTHIHTIKKNKQLPCSNNTLSDAIQLLELVINAFDRWYELVCNTGIKLQTIKTTLHLLALLLCVYLHVRCLCVCVYTFAGWLAVHAHVSTYMLIYSEPINHKTTHTHTNLAIAFRLWCRTQNKTQKFNKMNRNTQNLQFSPERNNHNDIKSMNHRWWFHLRIMNTHIHIIRIGQWPKNNG